MVLENNTIFNTSKNGTLFACSELFDWSTFNSFALIIYIITTVMSFFGNSLVLAVILKDSRLKTSTNYFICNMCASDVLVPFFPLLWHIMFVEHPQSLKNKILASLLCKLTFFLYDTSAAVSVQSLVVIAVDRFFAIVFRTKKQLKKPRICVLVICFIWLSSVMCFLPYLTYMVSDGRSCYTTMDESEVKGFVLLAFIIFRVLPLIILVSLYSKIVNRLRRQKPCSSHKQQERRRRRNIKVTKLLIVIVSFFFCCWFLPMLLQIVQFFTEFSCWLYSAMHVATVFPLIHSATGPFIYFIGCEIGRASCRERV